jgi:hypothetical protein
MTVLRLSSVDGWVAFDVERGNMSNNTTAPGLRSRRHPGLGGIADRDELSGRRRIGYGVGTAAEPEAGLKT